MLGMNCSTLDTPVVSSCMPLLWHCTVSQPLSHLPLSHPLAYHLKDVLHSQLVPRTWQHPHIHTGPSVYGATTDSTRKIRKLSKLYIPKNISFWRWQFYQSVQQTVLCAWSSWGIYFCICSRGIFDYKYADMNNMVNNIKRPTRLWYIYVTVNLWDQ